MPKVINGNYDFSLARWFYTPERQLLLDFVDIGTDKAVLALHKQSLNFDMKMLIKPFQTDVWKVMLSFLATILVSFVIFQLHKRNVISLESEKVLKMVAWLTFVILHAYYAGAMTMFFTSKPTLGFTTLRDVLQAIPEWKLIFLKGMDVHFEEPVSQVILIFLNKIVSYYEILLG